MGSDIDTVVIGACWTCYFDVGDGSLPKWSATAGSNYYYREGSTRHPLRGGDGVGLAVGLA